MGHPNCLTGLVMSQDCGYHSCDYITGIAGKASVLSSSHQMDCFSLSVCLGTWGDPLSVFGHHHREMGQLQNLEVDFEVSL